jgi:CBS domain-containing protein
MKIEEFEEKKGKITKFGVISISPDATQRDCYATMKKLKVHHLLVVDETMVVGVVADRDLWEKGYQFSLNGFDESKRVKDVMTVGVPIVDGDDDMTKIFEVMQEFKTSAVPVAHGGEITGLVTDSDLIAALKDVMGGEMGSDDELNVVSGVILANPIIQRAMKLLADIGI